MLERFKRAKEQEIKELVDAADKGRLPHPYTGERLSFSNALISRKGLPAIIAEYKRASPSRGIINENISVETAASEYAQAGASALSILTEKEYFHGELDYILQAWQAMPQKLPILRKDFIFDPLQVRATAATPAAAVLLIVALTPDAQILRQLREEAEKFNIDAVVEVLNEEDLHIARESGAKIIQVNARDLNTLKVDCAACLDVIKKGKPQKEEIWIAASGMSKPHDILAAADAGFDAVLIGTSLMKNANPGNALRNLIIGAADGQ